MSVQILLSAFNGERYLRPLLESLLAQDYPDLSILIRDDGSNDGTTTLLQDYAGSSKSIDVVYGEHVGFIQSFFSLIGLASPEVKYLALCDQDDVWLHDKVLRAVKSLASYATEVPALYCSRLSLVDESLRPLGLNHIPKKGLSFRNALVENQASGCTMLLNQAARRLLAQVPSYCLSHDWWIYLAVSAYGTIVYDPEPRILYRKHGANTIGVSSGLGDLWRNKIVRFFHDAKLHRVVRQAEEFRRLHGPYLPDEQRQILERFVESRRALLDRLTYALRCDVYRQSTLDQWIMRARIAMDCL